jgi:four helix bundle protein
VNIKSYCELKVWQKAHELTLLVFRLTEKFPKSDLFGIVSQVRRSSSSLAANIAEGFGKGTTRELLRFAANSARRTGRNALLYAFEP